MELKLNSAGRVLVTGVILVILYVGWGIGREIKFEAESEAHTIEMQQAALDAFKESRWERHTSLLGERTIKAFVPPNVSFEYQSPYTGEWTKEPPPDFKGVLRVYATRINHECFGEPFLAGTIEFN